MKQAKLLLLRVQGLFQCGVTAGVLHDWGWECGPWSNVPMCTSGLYEGHDKASSSLPAQQRQAPGSSPGIWA